VDVWEADDTYVGGISPKVGHKGFRFDIGGHRFFSKSAESEHGIQQALAAFEGQRTE
jgi:protoporphyrinogen oxidase